MKPDDPVSRGAERAIAHLNDDHADALLEMAQALGGRPEATAARCLDADRTGLDLLAQTPAGEREVRVCVLDRGPGVAPDERDRIFEKFYTKSADKALVGLGLGLFICRELVRLHGGRIWLEDRDGGGSCFCFTLPRLREEGGDAQ